MTHRPLGVDVETFIRDRTHTHGGWWAMSHYPEATHVTIGKDGSVRVLQARRFRPARTLAYHPGESPDSTGANRPNRHRVTL